MFFCFFVAMQVCTNFLVFFLFSQTGLGTHSNRICTRCYVVQHPTCRSSPTCRRRPTCRSSPTCRRSPTCHSSPTCRSNPSSSPSCRSNILPEQHLALATSPQPCLSRQCMPRLSRQCMCCVLTTLVSGCRSVGASVGVSECRVSESLTLLTPLDTVQASRLSG